MLRCTGAGRQLPLHEAKPGGVTSANPRARRITARAGWADTGRLPGLLRRDPKVLLIPETLFFAPSVRTWPQPSSTYAGRD